MTDIVYHRGCHRNPCAGRVIITAANTSANGSGQLPCCMKNSEAVSEPRMCRARKNKLTESQLLYAPEPLEGRSLHNAPKRKFQLALIRIRGGTKLN
jgi:hypothetical protein